MKHPTGQIAAVVLTIVVVHLLGGCGLDPLPGPMTVTEAQSQKLMAMAAEEAGKIKNPDWRLTRQLNVADLQIDRHWPQDAKTTLAAARDTLNSADAAKLNDHARISGWVSISELSREINDLPSASVATEGAVRELNQIQDLDKRCKYVMGIANELQYVKGPPAAAALLASAGPWTLSIDSIPNRRHALIAFSTALFKLNDFNAGQQMLEQEPDPAWRSDVLAMMATPIAVESKTSQAHYSPFSQSLSAPPSTSVPGSIGTAAESDDSPYQSDFYGKPLHYDQIFKNQKQSQTTKD